MNKSIQTALVWCGPLFVVVFFSGLLISGFFPPIPPDHSAAEVANQYRTQAGRIRTGCLIMLIATGFIVPFAAVISTQMARAEGRWTPLAWVQLACGSILVLAIAIPVLLWSAAAFRPDRDPADIQLLNDMGWFPFIMNWPFTFAQVIAIAVAILADKRPVPVYPRWIGYYLIWTAVAFTPASLLTYFKTGPFAWNGLLSFWLAAVFFGGLFIVMTWGTLRAVRMQFAEPSSDPTQGATMTPATA